jgi:hypothetical protein
MDRIGGLVGWNGSGSITRSYSTAVVIGGDAVGGLVGMNPGYVIECYSAGRVSGDKDVGGLVGFDRWATALASFWDKTTSGKSVSAGGTGKTRAQMRSAGTFLEAGWDFMDESENGTDDIWWILEGQDYPRLWWELGNEDLVE